ncbi:hypothetical protein C0416_01335 [bacterium]|nr:hypothetical protein [bacterium]
MDFMKPAINDMTTSLVRIARRTLHEWDEYLMAFEALKDPQNPDLGRKGEPSDFFHAAFVLSDPKSVKKDNHEGDLVHGSPTTRYLLTVRAIKRYLEKGSVEDLFETIKDLDGKLSNDLLELKMIVHDVIDEEMRLKEIGSKGLERLPAPANVSHSRVPRTPADNLRNYNKDLVAGVINID